jgi:adenine-specific DNA-methyltransferase
VTIHFKLKTANVEQNNVKGEARFFIPRPKEIVWDAKARQLVIPFEFRPLTEQETVTYGTKNQQDKINADAADAIPKRLSPKDHLDALAVLTAERRKTSDGTPVNFLQHHLRQYTQRNTSDFFIHKDLKGFLSGELDFYLKNEVLNLDEMETAGEDRSEGWFQVMRVIKAVGGRIIEFLDQIESFQKMLWEKRKFITETQYCITVGTIDERFYPEIAASDAQWAEWKDLFHIDEEKTDLFTNGKNKKDRRVAFLKAHPTLVLDTKHLDGTFADTLLGSMPDLDGRTDGLLIHSENWQALNLLLDVYRATVKCIYIDPPYNTGNDEFIYRDNYKHSSWMSMLADRTDLGRALLAPNGIFFSHIDDNELFAYKLLLDGIFGPSHFVCSFAWAKRYAPPPDTKDIGYTHEAILAYRSTDAFQRNLLPLTEDQTARYQNPDDDPRGAWKPMDYTCRYTAEERRNLYYAVTNPNTGEDVWPKKSRVWAFSQSEHKRNELEGRIWWGIGGRNKVPALKNFLDEIQQGFMPTTLLHYDLVGHTDEASKELRTVLPGLKATPKPTRLVEHLLTIGAGVEDVVLDSFAGSGTTAVAVLKLNRKDGGRRRFFLVEMGRYFDTVLLPRIKKVIFTPEWKDGKPKRMATTEEAERSPRIVKYMRLESYEDALNNIAFDDATAQATLKFEDYLLRYMLRYMLRWETRKSETLLNVEKLARPFTYKLTLTKDGESVDRAVDVPETFNYLLGLHVATRKVHDDDGRRYLVYRGTIDHRQVAVIWRETDGWQKKDLERDKKFVASQKLTDGADEVFVNGDSFIPNARALEPVFKARMFSTVEA